MAISKIAKRFDRIYQIGCIACIQMGLYFEPCQAHHLNGGGQAGQKIIGDDATIGLCPWHHQGNPGNMTEKTAMELKGPSLAKHSRKFRAMFGTDKHLLGVQNKYIAQAEAVGFKGFTW